VPIVYRDPGKAIFRKRSGLLVVINKARRSLSRAEQEHAAARSVMGVHEKKIATALRKAFKDVRDAIKVAPIQRALADENLSLVEDLINPDLLRASIRPVMVAYQDAMRAGGNSALATIDLKGLNRVRKQGVSEFVVAPGAPPVEEKVPLNAATGMPLKPVIGLPPGTVVDMMALAVVDHVRAHSAELVEVWVHDMRQAVRSSVLRAYESGIHPSANARHIKGLVGLTERQAAAADKFRERLLADGLGKAQAQARTDRYVQRLHRYRANNIARTESAKAIGEGRREMWRQLEEQGVIDKSRIRRRWFTAMDERVCDVCEPLDGQTAPLDGEYEGGVSGPPAHPQCRCTERLSQAL